MRTQLLVWSLMLCLASALEAQQWPAAYNQPYPQGYPAQPMFANPNPYGAGYTAPMMPAAGGPKIYYGEQPLAGNAAPAVPVSRPTYLPTQYAPVPAYNNGGGSIYYAYPDTPTGAAPYNFYPFAQQGKSMPPRSVAAQPSGWPTPTPKTAYAQNGDVEESPRAEYQRLAALPFHRPTKDRFWISGDYSAAFIRPMRMNGPLLTIGSPFDASPGALSQPGTSVLFPRQNIDFGIFSGMKLESGLFLDDCDRFSLELGGFWLFANHSTFNAGADNTGNPTLSRPVYSLLAGQERAFLNSISAPVVIVGKFNADFRSAMYGAEFNARFHSYWWQHFHTDFLAGFRYVNLSERMTIQEQLTPFANNFLTFQGANNFINPPNMLADQDFFGTVNHFYGAQIGARLNWEHRWFTVGTYGKLALGATQQITTIDGSTSVLSPAGTITQTAPGGVLALPTNAGTHSRTVFGIVPEFGLNLGIELTQHTRLQLGYSFLMWNRVVRPGMQYDRTVNPLQAPSNPAFGPLVGPIAPLYHFNDESFWMHSFNIGILFHY